MVRRTDGWSVNALVIVYELIRNHSKSLCAFGQILSGTLSLPSIRTHPPSSYHNGLTYITQFIKL